MASALLASRNEPYWGERKVYMGKNPNPSPKLCPDPNPSLNRNPNFNHQIPNGHEPGLKNQLQPMESDDPGVPPATTAAVSDDSSSFSRKPVDLACCRDPGGYVTFNVSTYSREEIRELKRRLILELDQVRSAASRIETRELQFSVGSAGALPSVAGSDGLVHRSAPYSNQFHSPDENKKRPVAGPAAAPELKKLHTAMMKRCGLILTKLMKQKGAVWFNSPVDVVGMGLHDYNQIIKNPMDLGTVKSKLGKGCYLSAIDFASDIRLTFNNALVYNPEGHDVHTFARQLLQQFEASFGPAFDKYEKQRGAILRRQEEERQRHLMYAGAVPLPPTPSSLMRAEPSSMISPQPQLVQPPPRLQQQRQQPVMKAVKQPPRPKVTDPNKRPMSMEEKEKLGAALQNLPEDKMTEVLQIVSKRHETQQNGDEVEIDFELMDNETLWELDRFVANWNKMMSKIRKQKQLHESAAEAHDLHNPSSVPAPMLSPPPGATGNKSPAAEETPESNAAKRSKKGDPLDEDVDIGDEMPATVYPSVEIAKESSSSSSGSDSSSSNDSDSDSSSGSDSAEDDDARSPAGGSRRSPRS